MSKSVIRGVRSVNGFVALEVNSDGNCLSSCTMVATLLDAAQRLDGLQGVQERLKKVTLSFKAFEMLQPEHKVYATPCRLV